MNKKKLRYNDREYPCTQEVKCCLKCMCFDREEPYRKHKLLQKCQKSPESLYVLAEKALNNTVKLPKALGWSVEDVVNWMVDTCGFPQYKECIRKNHIDGMRLVLLEFPSYQQQINIHYHEDNMKIVRELRKLYTLESIPFIDMLRNHMPWNKIIYFKSRSGPPHGFRQSTTLSEILRLHKVIGPPPTVIDHWDLVWYVKKPTPKYIIGKTIADVERKKKLTRRPSDLAAECKLRQKVRQLNLKEEEHIGPTNRSPASRTKELERLRRCIEITTPPKYKLLELPKREGAMKQEIRRRKARVPVTWNFDRHRDRYTEEFERFLQMRFPDAYPSEFLRNFKLED